MSTYDAPYSGAELDYYTRAPAFDGPAWERLTSAAQEFRREHDGDVYVLVRLFSGDIFPVVRVTPRITWARFELEDGSVRGVAVSAIEQVIITHRPPDAPTKRSVGFTVTD
jgi:hypothetical protein